MIINLDLDGTLADFNGHYARLFGVRPNMIETPPNFWKNIAATPDFYFDLEPLPDFEKLVSGTLARLPSGQLPVILTGCPRSIPDVRQQKRRWVDKYLGPQYPVVCTESATKSWYCDPGDVLIDDWVKYRHLWEEAEGHFILHISAVESLYALDQYLYAHA
jgi:hypothetical protein